MAARPRTPVLFVHHRSELGGAPASLSYLIRELDHAQFEAHIYCPPGPAAELFRQAGANVHTGPVAGFTHIWASTYRGRRWLLFLRELGLLPQHVVRFRRTLRRGRYELVHFNDSPLIPAAWLARREGLPVVWHLRSALPEGGHDRRSELIRNAIRRLATTSIAINHDVAGVFGVGSTVVPNSVDLERFHPGDGTAAKAELGRPVIEAAASGVPVVASGSRTGGGVVVPEETGVLVEGFGPDDLAGAVAELLRDDERRRGLGRAARAHAELNFDPTRNARR